MITGIPRASEVPHRACQRLHIVKPEVELDTRASTRTQNRLLEFIARLVSYLSRQHWVLLHARPGPMFPCE